MQESRVAELRETHESSVPRAIAAGICIAPIRRAGAVSRDNRRSLSLRGKGEISDRIADAMGELGRHGDGHGAQLRKVRPSESRNPRPGRGLAIGCTATRAGHDPFRRRPRCATSAPASRRQPFPRSRCLVRRRRRQLVLRSHVSQLWPTKRARIGWRPQTQKEKPRLSGAFVRALCRTRTGDPSLPLVRRVTPRVRKSRSGAETVDRMRLGPPRLAGCLPQNAPSLPRSRAGSLSSGSMQRILPTAYAFGRRPSAASPA